VDSGEMASERRYEGRDAARVTTGCLRPLVDACPPERARGARIASDQVEMQMLDAVTDDGGVDVLRSLCGQGTSGGCGQRSEARRFISTEVAQFGDMAARFDEEVAEIPLLLRPRGCDERKMRHHRVLISDERAAGGVPIDVSVLVADEARQVARAYDDDATAASPASDNERTFGRRVLDLPPSSSARRGRDRLVGLAPISAEHSVLRLPWREAPM
jgi:hypothetical protein